MSTADIARTQHPPCLLFIFIQHPSRRKGAHCANQSQPAIFNNSEECIPIAAKTA
jgi:hypothetical protein